MGICSKRALNKKGLSEQEFLHDSFRKRRRGFLKDEEEAETQLCLPNRIKRRQIPKN